ncbi:UNVERIFIED_CONTAM: hypothetical protein HDU68_003397, partial [Siphonaria sp. JEL0065]
MDRPAETEEDKEDKEVEEIKEEDDDFEPSESGDSGSSEDGSWSSEGTSEGLSNDNSDCVTPAKRSEAVEPVSTRKGFTSLPLDIMLHFLARLDRNSILRLFSTSKVILAVHGRALSWIARKTNPHDFVGWIFPILRCVKVSGDQWLLDQLCSPLPPSQDPNYQDAASHLECVFYFACVKGLEDVVRYMIQNNVFPIEQYRHLGFRLACFYGHVELVKLFLQDERTEPNCLFMYGFRAARARGHNNVKKLLLSDPRVTTHRWNQIETERRELMRKILSELYPEEAPCCEIPPVNMIKHFVDIRMPVATLSPYSPFSGEWNSYNASSLGQQFGAYLVFIMDGSSFSTYGNGEYLGPVYDIELL